MVGAVDRILDVEHRRQGTGQIGAIVDIHLAARALRHHLDGAALAPADPHADQIQAEVGGHRLGDRGDARGKPGLAHDARILANARHDSGFWPGIGAAVRCVCIGRSDRLHGGASGPLRDARNS